MIKLALHAGLAILAVAAPAPPASLLAEDPGGPARDFAEAVEAVTGDWTMWQGYNGDAYAKDGNLLLHPDNLDAQRSPVNMRLFPEEPALGRTARTVLSHHFEPMTIEGQAVDFSTVRSISDHTIAVAHQWVEYAASASNDEQHFGFWGVITTRQGSFVPFRLQCRRNYEHYGFEQCLQAGARIMSAIGVGALRIPDPQTPIAVSGFSTEYGNDGFTTLTRTNYNRTVNAVIRVSPPVDIQPAQMAEVLTNFSTTLFDEYDLNREDRAAMRFVGSLEEPWIRRELDQDSYGPNIVMAGLVKHPDGRHSLVGVNCPGPGWLSPCAYGIDQAKLFVSTGIAETRRLAAVSAATIPLPARGLLTSDVVAVYSVGRVIGIDVYQNFAVLLKDGRAYNNNGLAPQMIDAAAPPQDIDTAWGRWKRTGKGVVVTWDDGDSEEFSGDTATTQWSGGTRATRLSGYFGNLAVSGNAFSGGVVNRSGYTLNADGTFQSSSSSSFSVNAYLPNGNVGPTQIASGGSSDQSARARYEIDGFMITFYHPDGRIERGSFAVPADEAGSASPTQIMLGGRVLRRDFR